MGEIFIAFLTQLLFTVGIIVLFGLLIASLNRMFYRNLSGFGLAPYYVTGFIGTPIHELSHALFCVIFGHKVEEIKLFQISGDGTLGYVNHSYNPKNIYHKIGNFFIGVAPIIGVALVFYLLTIWMLPAMASEMVDRISLMDVELGLGDILANAFGTVVVFFSYAGNWQWWLFVILGMFLALHMTLSTADIKGAGSGILTYILVLLVINIILGLIGVGALNGFTSVIISVGSFLINYLIISVVLSIIAVLVSILIKKLAKI